MFDKSLNQSTKKKQLDVHIRFWEDDRVQSSWTSSFEHSHFLFHNVPARREDFTALTGSTCFPLPFCGHRWVVPVSERAVQVWPMIMMTFSPFLTNYQTDEPVLPFLAKDLSELLKSLLLRFVKGELLQYTTPLKLTWLMRRTGYPTRMLT
ncbi:hypothetical protein SKAU_G00074450 [Synaphobranchus kaupii]|uniref:Uncharacterized protein n=1 Tax=Synaphobranchus kaupii TaxID=118154 RepID=A0A9Q1G904_SYNKA|nr:hypothetical protein SKAU_G00074450 [Synaphobranchus kaupii]